MLRILFAGLWLTLGAASGVGARLAQRPVRMIVPYPAGGGTDTVARTVAQRLGDVFGQRFIVENRTGASGMLGAEAVAKADADGYTLLVGSPAEIALNQNLFKDMAYDPLRDLTPVTLLAWTPLVLAAHPSFAASIRGAPPARARPAGRLLVARDRQLASSDRRVHQQAASARSSCTCLTAAPRRRSLMRWRARSSSRCPACRRSCRSCRRHAEGHRGGEQAALAAVPEHSGAGGDGRLPGGRFYQLVRPLGSVGHRGGAGGEAAQGVGGSVEGSQVREILVTQAAEPVGNTPDEFRDFIRAEAEKYARIVELAGLKVK